MANGCYTNEYGSDRFVSAVPPGQGREIRVQKLKLDRESHDTDSQDRIALMIFFRSPAVPATFSDIWNLLDSADPIWVRKSQVVIFVVIITGKGV